jgi:uncharacterized membrane protein YfcA
VLCSRLIRGKHHAIHSTQSAGFIIGVVASLLGVAGGELLIPTLVLLFGADIKLAGSLSLAVSLPTMLVGFTRYTRDQSFAVVGRNKAFLLVMAAGSIVGTFIGAASCWGWYRAACCCRCSPSSC